MKRATMSDGRTTISHDPSARCSVVRETFGRAHVEPCTWCGSRPGRFAYGIEPDDAPHRVMWLRGRFCSIHCARCYHEGL